MPYYLPDRFRFKHNFVFFLHDVLATIVKTGEEKGVFFHSFKLKDKKEADEFNNSSGSKIIDLLISKGYDEEVDEIIKRQIFDAVLCDFLHYLYTALDTSEKGKLSVSFALLRKPFKDNLFILEWILADPKDFFKKFRSVNSHSEIAIDRIRPEKKLSIISAARSKMKFSNLPADFLYDLRYDKNKAYGLESIWNKANHLITSYKDYATEDMNLNFVFSHETDKENQWEEFYFVLPSLLIHSLFVCDAIYCTFSDNNSIIDNTLLCKIVSGYALTSKQHKEKNDGVSKELKLVCNKCNEIIDVTLPMESLIYSKELYKCSKGHKTHIFEI